MTKLEFTEHMNQVDQPGMSRIKRTHHDMKGKQVLDVRCDDDTDSDTQSDARAELKERSKDPLKHDRGKKPLVHDRSEKPFLYDRSEKPKMHDRSTSEVFSGRMPQLQSAKEGWVIYAVHPNKGQFIVNEGVNLVGEEQIVSGGALQGFYSVPVPPTQKQKIRQNARLGHPLDTVMFPNLFMLAPWMKRLAEAAFDLAVFGHGEVTDSTDVPEDVVTMSVPPPRGNYSVPRTKPSHIP